jgi:hypothetical protein
MVDNISANRFTVTAMKQGEKQDCSEAGDKHAKDWNNLHELLYAIDRNLHDRHRSNFVYRGVGDKCWDLRTSLQRIGAHCADVEQPLLRNFLKYAGPGQIASDALLYRLAVAQHYGLPTRVLDWTTSPKVALHFATCEEQHFDKDAAIWCVDVVKMRRLLPQPLRKRLDDEKAFLFSIEMLDKYKRLSELDDEGGKYALFFEPPSLDGRIVNQGAVLSIMPGAKQDLRELLRENPDVFWRVIIPKDIKWEVRDKLDQDNITERMLFPGMAGTSSWLKRYYGLGPRASNAAPGPVNPPGQPAPPWAPWLSKP